MARSQMLAGIWPPGSNLLTLLQPPTTGFALGVGPVELVAIATSEAEVNPNGETYPLLQPQHRKRRSHYDVYNSSFKKV